MTFLKVLLFVLTCYIGVEGGSVLLGAKECTWGPTYWCKNLTSAHNCHAVSHCIQTVWEHQTVPVDNDNICTICKNMVIQARDQLESNQTMDEIRQVFEGTCKLIYVKPAVKICDKIADELVPELVDTLSSQMNPDVVCSVAGLCNNAEIDQAINDEPNYKKQNCDICSKFISKSTELIHRSSDGPILQYLLNVCGKLSSYSDGCRNIVLNNAEEILKRIRSEFLPDRVCYLSGSCVNNRKPLPGDETCDLCKQLVLHVKDLLISDTSEMEFIKVIKGVCKQTGKFAEECLSLVNQYGDEIYKTISKDLDGERICGFFEICPEPGVVVAINGPISPMIPPAFDTKQVSRVSISSDDSSVAIKKKAEPGCPICLMVVESIKDQISNNKTKEEIENVVKKVCEKVPKQIAGECEQIVSKYTEELIVMIVAELTPEQICAYLNICKPKVFEGMLKSKRKEIAYGDSIESSPSTGLPLNRLTPPQLDMDLRVNGQQTCIFCQYILHYMQKVITQPYGEDAIKRAFDGVCGKLPKSVSVQCVDFVNLYGDAFVALLAQEIDPSQICPSLHICPALVKNNRYELQHLSGQPTCPLCLYVMETIDDELKDEKNEKTIRNALEKACSKLPTNIVKQCDELIDKYSEELIDLLIADFTPNEICVYLKFCKPKKFLDVVQIVKEPYEILTNEIPGNEWETVPKKISTPVCIICEMIMKQLDGVILKNSSQEAIKSALDKVCQIMPQKTRPNCEKFLVQYTSEILNTLAIVDPKEACSMMVLCSESLNMIKSEIKKCAVCEAVVGAIDALLEDPETDFNLVRDIGSVCNYIPTTMSSQCHDFINNFGPQIIAMIVELGLRPSEVCWKLHLCTSYQAKVKLVENQSFVGSVV